MFSLIITIISIALVAALALATIYYGGTAFNKGSAEAKASQLINEGQQINGAVALARADVAQGALTAAPTDINGLVASKHLAQVPTSFDGTTLLTASAVLSNATVTGDVCLAVNKKAGVTLAAVTAMDPAILTAATGKVYSCFNSGTEVAPVYKVSYAF